MLISSSSDEGLPPTAPSTKKLFSAEHQKQPNLTLEAIHVLICEQPFQLSPEICAGLLNITENFQNAQHLSSLFFN